MTYNTTNTKRVFEIFEEICSIPHGSGDMERISEWCVNFAKNHSLRYIKDECCNVIIFKDGSKGREKESPIILQGHLDMVCQKTEESNHDFLHDGIDFYYEDGFMKANCTTLGADDGIGVAITLAILESSDISHPPIEAVFTTDEEIGMYGALALDTSVLSAKRMINIDSGSFKTVTVSCAGGRDVLIKVPLCRTNAIGYPVTITLDGLQGGHSGGAINKNRLNADILLGRILGHLRQNNAFNIISLTGGDKGNAIVRSAAAKILVQNNNTEKSLSEYISVIKKEIEACEPDFFFSVKLDDKCEASVIDNDTSDRIVTFLATAPQGVFSMSSEIEGLVESSGNLGSIKCHENEMSFLFLFRSCKETSLDWLIEKIRIHASILPAEITLGGAYPAWEFVEKSSLQKIWCESFEELLGYKPKIYATHAGLECGIFTSKIQGLDCISVGPIMSAIHTIEEKLDVDSVGVFFKVLTSALDKI